MERESSLPEKKGRMDAEVFVTGMLSFCYVKDIQIEKSIRWLVGSWNKISALEIQTWSHHHTESTWNLGMDEIS